MKIILLEDVKALGKKGDVKEVAEGYGRNCLLPKKLAIIATPSAQAEVEAEKEKERILKAERTEKARALLEGIKGKKFIIKAKDRNGKLFGRIGAKEIVEELGKDGFDVDEKAVVLENPIKKVGMHKVRLKLLPDMETEIVLSVERGN